ncbi:hypothetical protein H2200_012156 [Cladophialophora chaetospira]|uniref:Uncharacterized protein n=1 Tax=Cladophialophora chaetospira TaxID=386627 RepID=A0AA39CCL9_9EURO|nr:hypothetical protein H2200_012156 [Cladophialophora chaetospira]
MKRRAADIEQPPPGMLNAPTAQHGSIQIWEVNEENMETLRKRGGTWGNAEPRIFKRQKTANNSEEVGQQKSSTEAPPAEASSFYSIPTAHQNVNVSGGDRSQDPAIASNPNEAQEHISPVLDLKKLAKFLMRPGRGVDKSQGQFVTLIDGSFLHIQNVIQDHRGIWHFQGHRFVRQETPELLIPPYKHEVVRLIDMNSNQLVYTISEDDVSDQCSIVFTNLPYAKLNFTKDVAMENVEDAPIFFCRYDSANLNLSSENRSKPENPTTGLIKRIRGGPSPQSLVVVTVHSQKIEVQIPDRQLREQWRGEGRYAADTSRTDSTGHRQYTFADVFCSAGGVTLGALNAGMEVKYGLDHSEHATATYAKNFEGDCKHLLKGCVHDFVSMVYGEEGSDFFVVDFQHISPPCQPFVPVNRPKKDNPEMNAKLEEKRRPQLDAFKEFPNLIAIGKPRFVTMEESME